MTDANNTIAYTYDDNGIRTSKTVNGTKTDYYLNGTAIIMQKTGDQCIWYTYDESGNLSGLRVGNSEYYYYRNGQGDIIGIIDGTGSIAAKYSYDAWGTPIAITDGAGNDVSGNVSHIANINPFRYRGYFYDVETGLYYLQSRYYDPQVGRFINIDSAIGVNRDMATYNLFVYCGNNAVVRYDAAGLFWKELIRDVIHAGNDFLRAIGIDTAAIGAFFLMMEEDENGIYHATFDCWQQYFGYNDLYDFAFDVGTSMLSEKFSFTYNGTNYMIWAWKGDYINLGAGAEIGIYYGNEPHWLVDKGLAMPMGLELQYKGERIISMRLEVHWWCTGFNPDYQNVRAEDLTAIFLLAFTDPGMYMAFSTNQTDPRWSFYNNLQAALFQF